MVTVAYKRFVKLCLSSCLICHAASFIHDFSACRRRVNQISTVNGGQEAVRRFPTALTDTKVNDISNGNHESKIASLVGYVPPDKESELKRILLNVGYADVITAGCTESGSSTSSMTFQYKYVKASGMLKLIKDQSLPADRKSVVPKYIPVQSAEENVLVANGWSFLDPDESEPMSAYDVDAANLEGQYKPKWGRDDLHLNVNRDRELCKLSSLGFHLGRLPSESVTSQSRHLSQASKEVLLNGGTDEPFQKITSNGHSFAGSISDIKHGIFTATIGGNIIFTTHDLSPLTASSGWLTFTRPIANDHIELVYAEEDAVDQRVEVIDARTGCHLGHYFGQDGYCINAGALNFFPSTHPSDDWRVDIHPVSWLKFSGSPHPMEELDKSMEIIRSVLCQNVKSESILLGAGCFWHVEFALRRLPGVIDTKVGYAGGSFPSPTYDDVCNQKTNHAEVVKVTFDPTVLHPRRLVDCFFAMHDPTMVKAHGEYAQFSGQYRSCVFVFSNHMEEIAKCALEECRRQLGKMLSTEVSVLRMDEFWEAEARHQRHDEIFMKKAAGDVETLMDVDWLRTYGRRASSIWGTSETIMVMCEDSNDDGMARMMI